MAAKGNTRHIRRLASSRYMKIGRKRSKYVAKPDAGRHTLGTSISLETVLKEKLMDATSREIKYALNRGDVEVNGKAVREMKYPIGFGDIVHVKPSGEIYRVVSGKAGIFAVEKADRKEGRTLKIIGKYVAKKGKAFIRLHDGSVMESDGKAKVNDSVVLGSKGMLPFFISFIFPLSEAWVPLTT